MTKLEELTRITELVSELPSLKECIEAIEIENPNWLRNKLEELKSVDKLKSSDNMLFIGD